MIRKIGDKWTLWSKDGSKKLFESSSKAAVEKREREINYFKHKKGKKK